MRELQIDVTRKVETETIVEQHLMKCNVYIDGRCVEMYMNTFDYNQLMKDKIFIRDGKQQDSAGVINTTNVFIEKI